MSGVLEELVAEIRALRADLDVRLKGLADQVADEVREQVEAILATAEPDERPARVSQPQLVVAPEATTATQTSPAKRAPRQDLASLVARAIDTLERDPTKAWKASELRPAINLFNDGTWSRVATRLTTHPAVVIAGNKLGRTYRAKKASRS